MRLLLFLILTFDFCLSFSQVSAPFSFTHYRPNNGLASNEVMGTMQDRNGFLWIATNRGLQRYDGVQYKTFMHREDDPTSLPENVVVQLLLESDYTLWVVTARGHVGIFDKSRFTYTDVPVKTGAGTYLRGDKKLIRDEWGNLFLVYIGQEVLQLDRKKMEFSNATLFLPLPKDWRISTLAQEPTTRKYWIGLQNGGIAIYNSATGNLNYFGNNKDKEPAIDLLPLQTPINHVFFDKKGRLWFASWGPGFPYCFLYDAKNKKKPLQRFEFLSRLNTYHEIHGFMQQGDGRLWVHGLQLFAYYNEQANSFEIIPNDFRAEQGIFFQAVENLSEDREKNMWVSTRNNALFRFNPSKQYFTNVAHINPKTGNKGLGGLVSFAELKNGTILASAWGDGLYRYDQQFNLLPLNIKGFEELKVTSVWDMYPSKDGDHLWMAAQPGLIKYSQSREAVAYINPPKLSGRTIRQVVEDTSGKLWMGMHNIGLYVYDPAKAKGSFNDGIYRSPAVPQTMVNHLTLDHKNWLWVSTATHGVFVVDVATGKLQLQLNSSMHKNMSNEISTVLLYSDSVVMIATVNALYQYNRGTKLLQTFVRPDALAGNIASMEKDRSGYLWVTTSNALYRVSMRTGSAVQFDRNDGIANDRFTIASKQVLKDGRFLFGSENEFIAFHPERINFMNSLPAVAITDIKVMDRFHSVDSILLKQKLTLRHYENSLHIDFSSLHYATQFPVRYMLEGLDGDWRAADHNMNAVYSYIPPGTYTLRLKALDAEGRSSERQLAILVGTPFWQTWWFYTALAIAFVLVLYRFDQQRMQRKERMQKVRTDIAGGLHQEVNTALNHINILSEIARLKSEKEPLKAREFIEQIHTKSHNMIIALDDMLWSLDPQNDAMDRTINRIREYADSLKQRYNVTIDLLIDKGVEGLQLDMKFRHEAFLLFKEGLRLIVEAGTPHCIVHLALDKGKLQFTIEFENEGADLHKLNNLLQRRDMEARLHDLGARLDVHVHKSRSILMLQLPI